MESKGAAIIALCIAGILIASISTWVLFYLLGTDSILATAGAFVSLGIGISLIVVGLKSP